MMASNKLCKKDGKAVPQVFLFEEPASCRHLLRYHLLSFFFCNSLKLVSEGRTRPQTGELDARLDNSSTNVSLYVYWVRMIRIHQTMNESD